jgi:hypothetical protein
VQKYFLLKPETERNDNWILPAGKIYHKKRQGLIDCLALPLNLSPVGVS